MSARWRPKIIYYGAPVTVTLTLPQRPWAFLPTTVGGARFAASGVGAAYEARRDELHEHTIRFTEAEYADVRAWVLFAQNLGGFDWYDDQDDPTTAVFVTLFEPLKGMPFRPTRSAEFPAVFEFTFTLRTVDGTPYTRAYFEE